jgi:hypothetical protein
MISTRNRNYEKEVWVFEETIDMPEEPIKSEQTTVLVDKKAKWREYRAICWSVTNSQPLFTLENIEQRGFRNMHLDHKISVWYGFMNGIDPAIIGDISNLRMIPYLENMAKGTRCV